MCTRTHTRVHVHTCTHTRPSGAPGPGGGPQAGAGLRASVRPAGPPGDAASAPLPRRPGAAVSRGPACAVPSEQSLRGLARMVTSGWRVQPCAPPRVHGQFAFLWAFGRSQDSGALCILQVSTAGALEQGCPRVACPCRADSAQIGLDLEVGAGRQEKCRERLSWGPPGPEPPGHTRPGDTAWLCVALPPQPRGRRRTTQLPPHARSQRRNRY